MQGWSLSWLWQGVVTNLVVWLLAVSAGSVMGWLKSRESSSLVTPILVGLSAVALILIILLATRHFFFPIPPLVASDQPLSPQEMENRVRTALELTEFSVRPLKNKEHDFHFVVTDQAGLQTAVFKYQDKRLVTIAASVTPSPEHRAKFSRLSAEQRLRFALSLERDLITIGVGYVEPQITPLGTLYFIEEVPITRPDTDVEFLYRFRGVRSAVRRAILAIRELETIKPESTAETAKPQP